MNGMKVRSLAAAGVIVAAASGVSLVAQQGETGNAPISVQQIRDGLKDQSRWLTYGGNYAAHRNSPLTQITPENVGKLIPQWTFQTDTLGKFEATPLVIDGVMYVTGPEDIGWAIDARTGRQIWRYRRDVMQGVIACCGRVNRGFAVLGDRLFKTTLDAHVVALNIKTGAVMWDATLEDYKKAYSSSAAPLIVKDKVVVGMMGGEYGVRGFIDAYDAQTGKRAWRFYTTAGPDDPGHSSWQGTDPKAWEHGGATTWKTGAYDPDLNLVYWGTGNAGPDYDGSQREGDNLYAASVVALDGDTGKLKWHYQFTPHDVWDWDATQQPVLADLTIGGQPRKAMIFANRNGFFYVLDRTTGKLIYAKPYINTTWAKEIGADGRPVVLTGQMPSEQGTRICPDQIGATNFMSPSYDPNLNLFFVTTRESCGLYYTWTDEYNPGERYTGGGVTRIPESNASSLRAYDPVTGEKKWQLPYASQSWAGLLSTASGLVFGGSSGNFMAADSRTGKALWKYQMGAALYTSPVTFMVDGRQYVVMGAGTNITAFALPQN
ncbi:MAG: PQQ-dependent dehydrogenase, methanol/ethanol family [Acidobacteria bacterium]|nr:PQQ-dependent dehydrogenase, methanol/ethanol family [Acidobacteriota bacterium]